MGKIDINLTIAFTYLVSVANASAGTKHFFYRRRTSKSNFPMIEAIDYPIHHLMSMEHTEMVFKNNGLHQH